MKLYMFRTVPLPIIRSLFTVHSAMVYVIRVCRQLSSRTRMELTFHEKLGRAERVEIHVQIISHLHLQAQRGTLVIVNLQLTELRIGYILTQISFLIGSSFLIPFFHFSFPSFSCLTNCVFHYLSLSIILLFVFIILSAGQIMDCVTRNAILTTV